MILWGGCSVEKHYEVLSFFFDGVPRPLTAEEAAAAAARGGPGRGAAMSRHSAYAERRCTDCHGDVAQFGFATSGFAALDGGVCLDCHEDVLDARHLHGPVAAVACLFCHDPHSSRYPALMKQPTPLLCLRCHDPAEQGPLSQPAHADLTQNCLECHFGHGGDERYYLRPADIDVAVVPLPAQEMQEPWAAATAGDRAASRTEPWTETSERATTGVR